MGEHTSITWCDHDRNFWAGCSEVFEIDPVTRCKHVANGVCRFCYLKRFEGRVLNFGYIRYYPFENAERDLKRWSTGKVFIENMGDILWERVPDVTVHAVIDILENVDTYKMETEGRVHQWQLLTKRAARMERFWRTRMEMTGRKIGANKWLGVSVGNKPSTYYIDHLWHLAQISPDFIPFVSFEPLLEDLMDFDGTYRRGVIEHPNDPIWQRYASLYDDEGMLDLTAFRWAIIGGESDAKSPRPMDPQWAEDIVTNCRKYGVKVFYKQSGGIGGDNAGGNLLNGRKIQEFPITMA